MADAELDGLDQQLIEAIIKLDVRAVRAALKSGADVQHTRKRAGTPIAPSVNAVALSHRMRDILEDPTLRVVRRFPQKTMDFLLEIVQQRREELGDDAVAERLDKICDAIMQKLGLPPDLRKMFQNAPSLRGMRKHK